MNDLPYNDPQPTQKAVEAIKTFIRLTGHHPNTIALCGPVGAGKTHDACALALQSQGHNGGIGGAIVFAHCSSIQRWDDEQMNRAQIVRFLILDDYGARQSEGALIRAYELLDTRMHNHKRITLLTTNLVSEIRDIDKRMASRLNTACIINYEGMPDRRLELYKKGKK